MSDVTTDHKWLQLTNQVVAIYNYWDCLATARASHAIKQKLKANQQLDYFQREVWPLLPAVLSMQRRGLPYNTQAKGQYRKKLRRELKECDTKLRTLYKSTANYEKELAEKVRIEALVANPPEGKEGQKYRARQTKGITLTKGEQDRLGRRLPETWNPNSDDQVRAWLFGDLGLRPSTTTAGGKPSVDLDALSRVYRNLRKKDEHARPALHNLMHRARLVQIDTQYLDPEVTNDKGNVLSRESYTSDGGTAGIRSRDTSGAKADVSHQPNQGSISRVESVSGNVPRGENEKDYLDPEVIHAKDGERRDSRKTDRAGNSVGLGRDQEKSGDGLQVRSTKLVGAGSRKLRTATDGDIEVGEGRTALVGRVYPTIKMTGTESGRMSYADPPVHSWPDEIRHLVEPTKGRVWLGADYQQVEARVFAILTNDTKDLEIYRRFDESPEDKGWDIHYRTAGDLFGMDTSELLSKPGEQLRGIRVYAKNFRYGVLLYGGGPTSTKAKVGCPCPKCIDSAPPTVDVTPAERKQHADRWFLTHPNVQAWRNNISYEVMRNHTLKGPLGQKWYFMKPWSTATQREAWNRIIQGTAASIINRAMVKLHTLGCPMCLQHHDALYSEVEERDLPYWAHTKKTVMEQPIPELHNRVFPVEIEVGPSWGEMREWTSQH